MKKRYIVLLLSIMIGLQYEVHGMHSSSRNRMKQAEPLLRINNQSSYTVFLRPSTDQFNAVDFLLKPGHSTTIPMTRIGKTIELVSEQRKFKSRTIDLTAITHNIPEYPQNMLSITIHNFWFWPRRITYTNPRWIAREHDPIKHTHAYHHYHKRHEQKLIMKNSSSFDIAYTYRKAARLQILTAHNSIRIPLYAIEQDALIVAPGNNLSLTTPIPIDQFLQMARKHSREHLVIEVINQPNDHTRLTYQEPRWVSHRYYRIRKEQSR